MSNPINLQKLLKFSKINSDTNSSNKTQNSNVSNESIFEEQQANNFFLKMQPNEQDKKLDSMITSILDETNEKINLYSNPQTTTIDDENNDATDDALKADNDEASGKTSKIPGLSDERYELLEKMNAAGICSMDDASKIAELSDEEIKLLEAMQSKIVEVEGNNGTWYGLEYDEGKYTARPTSIEAALDIAKLDDERLKVFGTMAEEDWYFEDKAGEIAELSDDDFKLLKKIVEYEEGKYIHSLPSIKGGVEIGRLNDEDFKLFEKLESSGICSAADAPKIAKLSDEEIGQLEAIQSKIVELEGNIGTWHGIEYDEGKYISIPGFFEDVLEIAKLDDEQLKAYGTMVSSKICSVYDISEFTELSDEEIKLLEAIQSKIVEADEDGKKNYKIEYEEGKYLSIPDSLKDVLEIAKLNDEQFKIFGKMVTMGACLPNEASEIGKLTDEEFELLKKISSEIVEIDDNGKTTYKIEYEEGKYMDAPSSLEEALEVAELKDEQLKMLGKTKLKGANPIDEASNIAGLDDESLKLFERMVSVGICRNANDASKIADLSDEEVELLKNIDSKIVEVEDNGKMKYKIEYEEGKYLSLPNSLKDMVELAKLDTKQLALLGNLESKRICSSSNADEIADLSDEEVELLKNIDSKIVEVDEYGPKEYKLEYEEGKYISLPYSLKDMVELAKLDAERLALLGSLESIEMTNALEAAKIAKLNDEEIELLKSIESKVVKIEEDGWIEYKLEYEEGKYMSMPLSIEDGLAVAKLDDERLKLLGNMESKGICFTSEAAEIAKLNDEEIELLKELDSKIVEVNEDGFTRYKIEYEEGKYIPKPKSIQEALKIAKLNDEQFEVFGKKAEETEKSLNQAAEIAELNDEQYKLFEENIKLGFDTKLACNAAKFGINIDKALKEIDITTEDLQKIYNKELYLAAAVKNITPEKFEVINKILFGERLDTTLAQKASELSEKYGVNILLDNDTITNSYAKSMGIVGRKQIPDNYLECVEEALIRLQEMGQPLPKQIYFTELFSGGADENGKNSEAAGVFCPNSPDAISVSLTASPSLKFLQRIIYHENTHRLDYEAGNNDYMSSSDTYKISKTNNPNFSVRFEDGTKITLNDIGTIISSYATKNNAEFFAEVNSLLCNGTIIKTQDGYKINPEFINEEGYYRNAQDKIIKLDDEIIKKLNKIMQIYEEMGGAQISPTIR